MATEASGSGIDVAALQRLKGPENMALDGALLGRAELGTSGLRVYRWDGVWVSLGRFQKPESDLVEPHRVPWVIRPTGGRGVLHGHDVTVAFSTPLASLKLGSASRSVREVYREVTRPLIRALVASGVDAALGEDTEFGSINPRSADCFAHVSANDIVERTQGTKVCGVAMRITERAVLIQASIPAGPPLVDPTLVFREGVRAHWIELNDSKFEGELINAYVKTPFSL